MCGLGQSLNFSWLLAPPLQVEWECLPLGALEREGEQKPTPTLAFLSTSSPRTPLSKIRSSEWPGWQEETKLPGIKPSSTSGGYNSVFPGSASVGVTGSQSWYRSWTSSGDALTSENSIPSLSLHCQQLWNSQLRDLVCNTGIQLPPLQRAILPQPEPVQSPQTFQKGTYSSMQSVFINIWTRQRNALPYSHICKQQRHSNCSESPQANATKTQTKAPLLTVLVARIPIISICGLVHLAHVCSLALSCWLNHPYPGHR